MGFGHSCVREDTRYNGVVGGGGGPCSLVFIPMIYLWVTRYPRNAISTGFYSPIKEGLSIASTPLPRLFSGAGFL